MKKINSVRSPSQNTLHILFQSLLGRIPWLSGLGRLVPRRWEGWLLPGLVLALLVYFHEDIQGLLKEWYGPDIVITALPERTQLANFGSSDLLYEFKVKRAAAATRVGSEAELYKLFETARPITLVPFHCGGKPAPAGHNLYKLSIISQNLGSQTAREYSVMLSFSGAQQADSGVHMLHLESDEFKVSYLYLQKPDFPRPTCLVTHGGKSESVLDPATQRRYPLIRATYHDLGLTRDVAILEGTLEARLFQTIEIIVAVPKAVRKFAVLYQVDCANCRWFYRTTSYAQILDTPGSQHAASDDKKND